MAAELKYVQPNVQVTLAHSRDKLLSAEPLPDMVKDCTLELTEQAGVEVLLNHRLASSTPTKAADGSLQYEVEFTNGHRMVVSDVITAVSNSIPSSGYLPAAALDSDGYVNVRPTMQLLSEDGNGVPNADSHFAVGDIIRWSGIKRCGGALYGGKIAAVNIHQIMMQQQQQQLETKEPDFLKLGPTPPMIGLAVGRNGISYGAEGMSYGPQVMQLFFEEDLGFRSEFPFYIYIPLSLPVNYANLHFVSYSCLGPPSSWWRYGIIWAMPTGMRIDWVTLVLALAPALGVFFLSRIGRLNLGTLT